MSKRKCCKKCLTWVFLFGVRVRVPLFVYNSRIVKKLNLDRDYEIKRFGV